MIASLARRRCRHGLHHRRHGRRHRTGAAPVIAQVAKEIGALTVACVLGPSTSKAVVVSKRTKVSRHSAAVGHTHHHSKPTAHLDGD